MESNKAVTKITTNQLFQYEQELKNLKNHEMKKISNDIIFVLRRNPKKYQRSQEFQSLLAKQRECEVRINYLEKLLNSDNLIVTDDENQTCRVIVKDCEYNEVMTFEIVPAGQANSLLNRLSIDSPLVKALQGKKEGDKVYVPTKGNSIAYSIISIEGTLPGNNADNNHIKYNDRRTVDLEPKEFLTRTNLNYCTNKKHTLEDINCRIKVLKPNGSIDIRTIPGAYCSNCDRYYINEDTYQQIKKTGVLLCRVVETTYWSNNTDSGYFGYNQESILHTFGYNVSSSSKLTQNQRWIILETVVDNEILSAAQISSHLRWLIDRSSYNENMTRARSKWETDLKHVLEYNSSQKRIVNANSIKSVKYRKSK